MRRHKLIFAIFLLVIVSSSACKKDDDATKPQSANRVEELTSNLENILGTTEVPGFALSIVENESIVYQQSFGYADLDAHKPYTNQTVQNMASVSKTFVGAAVIKAIQQGYFTIDTDINELLPVEIRNPKQPNAIIRVKHLVTHTSGLLDNMGVYLSENYAILPGEDMETVGAKMLNSQLGIRQGDVIPLEDFLAAYFLEEGDLFSLENFGNTIPGNTWSYSNLATGLMSFIIENVSGMPFDEYVKVNIFQPLDMNNSTYNIDQVNHTLLAKAYFDKKIPFPLYANHSYAEGGMYANNLDMGNYLLDMIKGYHGNSSKLFPKDGYELLFTKQLEDGIVPHGFADNHGIFWIHSGDKIIHGGNSFGISTYIEIDKKGNTGYTLMTNLDATFDQSKFALVGSRIDEAVQFFLSRN